MVQRQTKYGIATNNTLKKNAYINQKLKANSDIFIYYKNYDNYYNETVTVRNYSLDKQKRWELVEELQKQQEEEEQQGNNKPQLLTKKERKEKNQVNKKLNFEKSLTKSKYQNKLIAEEEKKKKLAQQQLEQLEEEENNDNYDDEEYYEEEEKQPKIKVLNAEKDYRQNPIMMLRINKDEKEDGQIEVFERPTRSELFKMNQQNKSRYDHKPVENRKSKKENFTNSLNL